MVYSMTGYGEASFENEDLRVGFRMKSVNNRGLDINLKLPFDFMYMESQLRKHLKKQLHRGRLDIFTEIEIRNPDLSPPVTLNQVRLNQLLSLSGALRQQAAVTGELDINTLVRLPDLTQNQRVGFRLPEALDSQIQTVLNEAIAALSTSRKREGEALRQFFVQTFTKLEKTLEALETVATARRADLRDHILKRLHQLNADLDLDPQRLAQEVVYLADRQDITEEVTRLRAHISASQELLASGKRPLGKELEFLVQEQFREVTTIGNKAKHQQIAEFVVQLKTDYEQIREQVLNVE